MYSKKLLMISVAMASAVSMPVACASADDVSGKYSSLAIKWSEPSSLTMNIRKTVVGLPAVVPGASHVTEHDIRGAKDEIPRMQDFLKEGISTVLEPLLKSGGVTVMPSSDQNDSTEATLSIAVESGFSECALLGCQHGVKLSISLTDNIRKSLVWSGSFRVAASWPSEASPAVAEKFYRRLIERFLRKKLKMEQAAVTPSPEPEPLPKN
jgi:hypothetical protein